MKPVLTLALVVGLTFAATCFGASDVLDATAANFDSLVAGDFVIAEFYAPWCGHCKKLAPIYEEAATKLKGKATFIKVDATAETTLAEKYGVTGYPTIKVFQKGELYGAFEGARTVEGFQQYIHNNQGPAVTVVTTAAQFAELKSSQKFLVAIFTKNTNSYLYEIFSLVAKELRATIKFIQIPDLSIAGSDGTPETITVFKQFDEPVVNYTGEVTQIQLKGWIERVQLPLFDAVTPSIIRKHRERNLPLAWIFDDGSEASAEGKRIVASVAPEFKGRFTFLSADPKIWNKMVSIRFKTPLETAKFPIFGVERGDNHPGHLMKDEITAENIRNFLTRWLAGDRPE